MSTKCDEPAASALPVETIRTSTVTGDIVSSTASRCRESIHQARSALDRAKAVHHAALGEEIVAAELRVALDELGKVVGTVYTDDVLDRVFRRFCVGK